MTSTGSPIVLATNAGKEMGKWEAISVGKKKRVGRSRVWIQAPATIYLAKFLLSVLVISSCHWICHLFDWEFFRQKLPLKRLLQLFPKFKTLCQVCETKLSLLENSARLGLFLQLFQTFKRKLALEESPQLQRTIVPKTNLTLTRATATEEATTCWPQL